ncbi:MAG: flagellar biosynthetic protein FliO [Casimicrobiaceae bacterium]
MPNSAIARPVLRPTSLRTVLGALAFACAGAQAASPGPVEPSFTGGLLQTLVGLGIVLALIWGAAWVMRRLNVGTQAAGSAIRVLASQALGQRERIVLVEVADQWLVLGVAPGHVSALSTLPKGTLPPRSATPAPFAALLARARVGRSDSDAPASSP